MKKIEAIIRDDLDSYYHKFGTDGDGGSPPHSITFGGTNITLSRTNGGTYDSTGYDSTSYNRGWVTIWYEE